jgi:hypothetical protein
LKTRRNSYSIEDNFFIVAIEFLWPSRSPVILVNVYFGHASENLNRSRPRFPDIQSNALSADLNATLDHINHRISRFKTVLRKQIHTG